MFQSGSEDSVAVEKIIAENDPAYAVGILANALHRFLPGKFVIIPELTDNAPVEVELAEAIEAMYNDLVTLRRAWQDRYPWFVVAEDARATATELVEQFRSNHGFNANLEFEDLSREHLRLSVADRERVLREWKSFIALLDAPEHVV